MNGSVWCGKKLILKYKSCFATLRASLWTKIVLYNFHYRAAYFLRTSMCLSAQTALAYATTIWSKKLKINIKMLNMEIYVF